SMVSAAAAAVVLLLSLAATVRCSVKSCEQAQVWARGRELLSAMKGQLVLVAFPNAPDKNTLRKLSSLAESHPSVRAIALFDPSSCSLEEAAVMGREWRWLIIDRDEVSTRQRLGLKQNEVALFDRCGRLARTLPLSSTEELKQAMRTAQHHANCGWCQYGTESGEGTRIDKKLDAFFQQAIVTQPPNQPRAYPHRQQQQHQNTHQMARQLHNPPPQRQTLHTQGGQSNDSHRVQQTNYEQQQQRQYQQRSQNQQSPPPSPYRTQQHSMGQVPDHVTHSQIGQHEYAQRGSNIPQTASAPTTAQSTDDYGDYDEVMQTEPKEKKVDLRKPSFNDDAQWATSSPFHQRRQHKDLFAMNPSTSSSHSTAYEENSRKPKTTVVPSTTTEKKKAEGFEDYEDYGDYGAMKTFTKSEEVQKETSHFTRSTQTRPRSIDPRNYDLENADEDEVNMVEVPCKAITDDICYHQKKSGRKLSKCCKKGIYIADFCQPGKCSNTTVQACCMQKYLQAKFQCCENVEMEGTTATDSFSRCCHAHFVEEVREGDTLIKDDCCSPEAAAEYWQSVHDICLPNVQADLSTVKFEIRLSDGIRVLDLAETEKWQHECKYGGRRAQYVYVP
ncbi:hypothetical protein PMAYCL1PPCAC_07449, partial [Pristionchus mayeri]